MGKEIEQVRNEIVKDMFDKLEKIRDSRGVSMRQFCSNSLLGRNWYSNALRGNKNISYADLKIFLESIGINIKDFV